MSVFRHGDDFVVPSTRPQQKEFEEEQLSKHLIVEHRAHLGPCPALGDAKEVRILNRIVRWVEPPYEGGCERIAELIIHQLGLSSSSCSVSTPSAK